MDLSLIQDKPLADVFRRIGSGNFPPVVELFERGKTSFFLEIPPKESIFC